MTFNSLSPAVITTETDLTLFVRGVSTTAAGFVGPFLWGPVNEIVTVDSEQTLFTLFGPPASANMANNAGQASQWLTAASFLAYSSDLKIVRTVGPNAKNAFVDIQNGQSNVSSLVVENRGDFIDKDASGTFTTAVNPDILFVAKYPSVLGNSLGVSFCANADHFSQVLLFTGSLGGVISSNNTSRINTSYIISATLNVGDNVQFSNPATGSVPLGSYSVVSIGSNFFHVTPPIEPSTLLLGAFTGATITRSWKYAPLFSGPPSTSSWAESRGLENDEMHLVVIDEDGKWTGIKGTVLEQFPFASKVFDAKNSDGSSNFIREIVNSSSPYIWMTSASASSQFGSNFGKVSDSATSSDYFNTYWSPSVITEFSLSGGADDNSGSDGTSSDQVAARASGYSLLADPETVDLSLVIMGQANRVLIQYVIDNVAHRRNDCVVFCSPPLSATLNVSNKSQAVDNIIAFKDQVARSTSYAFWDTGHKYMFDRYNSSQVLVPLNGDVAGLAARTDIQRDPWWSPAGFNRGNLLNVVRLVFNPTKTYRDRLYSNNVNPVVTFPNDGTILFGDKTALARPSLFESLGVRRLFIALRKSISSASKYQLFDFNNEISRSRFINLVEPFLREIQGRQGIIQFRVVCDESNNPPNVVDRGEFVGDIYIRPARSVQVVRLNFFAVDGTFNFTEIGG